LIPIITSVRYKKNDEDEKGRRGERGRGGENATKFWIISSKY